jgi:hypothetical protein
MTSATAVLNILNGNQQRMYNVIFAELYWNKWDKCRADGEILKFSQMLGQFVMKTGGEYFEYGEWSDGRQSELHD